MINFKRNNLIFNLNNCIFFYIVIFLYSYCFVYCIPWENFHLFEDIGNYFQRIVHLANEGKETEYHGLSIIFSEILWKKILIVIGYFEVEENYIHTLKIVSFISLAIYAAFTFKRINFFIGAIFFFNPMFIDLIMGQLRISLAFAFLLISFEFKSKKLSLSILFLLAAIFIHTASLLLFGIYFLLQKISSLTANRKYYFYSLLLSFLFPILLKFGASLLLMAVGDRRNIDAYPVSSISYSAIWFLIALVLLFKAEYGDKNKNIIIAFSITMMGLFFFSSIVGLYGQRYVAISIPLIIISINYLPKYYREMTFIALGIYLEIQWLYWLNISLL